MYDKNFKSDVRTENLLYFFGNFIASRLMLLKCIWHENFFLLIWKTFQNTGEWRFLFWKIFFPFRDIDIFYYAN